MIIRRETLRAVLPAASTDDTRYFLAGIRLEPATHRAIATNGHVLLIATDREPQADADFPLVPGAEYHGDPSPLTVSVDVIKAMIATMPKRSSLPILACTQLSTNGTDTGVTLVATDLTAPRVAKIDLAMQDRFPDYDRYLPKSNRSCVQVCLAVDVLETLIAAAKAVCAKGKHAGGPTITFDVPTDAPAVSTALGITIKGEAITVTGYAMPCRV